MIDSLSNLLFGCRHRRTSFPRSHASRRGAPQEDMYVVCLDCGKRFHYDWERMRIGSPAETTNHKKKFKLRYFLSACVLPAIWLISRAAKRNKPKEQEPEPKYGKHAD